MSNEPDTKQEEPEMTTTETPTPEPETTVDPAEPTRQVARTEEVMEDWRSGAGLEPRVEQLPSFDRWAQMENMAKRLARSPLMPDHIKNSRDPEGDCMVILLAAHDIGLSATVAFQELYVEKGRLGQSAALMRSLIRRDGHKFRCEVHYDDTDRPVGATAHGWRKEFADDHLTASFMEADAAEAKLNNKDNYKNWREDMYVARASARLARREFSDCLSGISYTPDELRALPVEQIDVEPPRAAVPEANLAALRKTIAALKPDAQQLLAARWKEAKLGSIQPEDKRGDVPVLPLDRMVEVAELIAAVKREAIEDADVVQTVTHDFEGSDTATECATCGAARDAEVHVCSDCSHPWSEHDDPSDHEPTFVPGCNHLDEDPEKPDEEGIPCDCMNGRPTVGPPEPGQSDVSPDGARESDVPAHISPQEGVATTAPGAAVDHHGTQGRPATTTADPTAEPSEARNDAIVAVSTLSQSKVMAKLAEFEIKMATSPAEQREQLIDALASRVLCEQCGAVQSGPAARGEAYCGCTFG